MSPDEKRAPRRARRKVLIVDRLADPGLSRALAATADLADRLTVAQEQEPKADLSQEVQDQEQEYLTPLGECPESLGPEQEHDRIQRPQHYGE